VPSATWDFSVSSHRDVSQAMAILTQRNKVSEEAVFSVSVDMVDQDYFGVFFVSAICAFSFEHLPRISFIGIWALIFQRLALPVAKATFVTAIESFVGALHQILRNVEVCFAKTTFEIGSGSIVCVNAFLRTVRRFETVVFLGYKFFVAVKAGVYDRRRRFSLKFLETKMVAVNEFSASPFRSHSAAAKAQFVFFSHELLAPLLHVAQGEIMSNG